MPWAGLQGTFSSGLAISARTRTAVECYSQIAGLTMVTFFKIAITSTRS